MIKSTPLPKFKVFAVLPVAAFLAASCGSYQQASYYDDGIYSSGDRVVHVEKKSAEAVQLEEQESNIYGDYFGAKANEYAEILDDEIFTDIDGYTSQNQNDTIPYGEQTDYFAYNNTYNGNPGWGDNPTSLTINVYDNWGWGGYYGWNNPYWGFGYGWGGYPYYNWGWANPWRYNRWGWGGYYGWGNPYYGGWGYAGIYGWGGYYNYGWRPYYYNNYYGRNYAYGYARGRRGYSSSTIPGTSLRGRSNLASRSSGNASRYRADSGRSNRSVATSRTSRSYSNGTTARRTVSADAISRNQNYRTSRSTRTSPNYSGSSRTYRSYGTSPSSRSNSTYQRSGNVNRSSSSPTYRSSGRSTRSYQSSPRTAPSRSNYNRSSSSGSSSRSYRSSGSRSSSSGSYRSSGSSSRSSGGASRSGGSSRSGRGNGRN